MWEGRELLGTIFSRWRRKPDFDQYSVVFVYLVIKFIFLVYCLVYFELVNWILCADSKFRVLDFILLDDYGGGLLKNHARV